MILFHDIQLRGFAEWIFIIGVYGVARELVKTNRSWITKLRKGFIIMMYNDMFPLSEMSLPFYLTHCQILIALASPLSWYPYISIRIIY